MLKPNLRRMLIVAVVLFIILVFSAMAILKHPSFGRLPQGERLERVKTSPNASSEGEFHNLEETPQIVGKKNMIGVMFDFLFNKPSDITPHDILPAKTVDLKSLARNENCFVWFGHSSYFIQVDGKRFLIDPVLELKFPASVMLSAFKTAVNYTTNDIPDIDYLVITHDHWDHLDYATVVELKSRIGNVICPLGVGEHFEFWEFDINRIIELDWFESKQLDDRFVIEALPTRHFSGRGLTRNRTLWASYMLQTPSDTIYIGGDGGYGIHIGEIAKRYHTIDYALMEDGQYNQDWRYIHFLPSDLVKAVDELTPKYLIPVHNSKFALARHRWSEPLDSISKLAELDSVTRFLTPTIGEKVLLNDSTQSFTSWWKTLK